MCIQKLARVQSRYKERLQNLEIDTYNLKQMVRYISKTLKTSCTTRFHALGFKDDSVDIPTSNLLLPLNMTYTSGIVAGPEKATAQIRYCITFDMTSSTGQIFSLELAHLSPAPTPVLPRLRQRGRWARRLLETAKTRTASHVPIPA